MTTVATTAPAPTAALAAPPAWRRLLTLARHALEASLIWLLLLAAWLAAARYLPLGHNPLIPAPDVTLRALVESLPELWTGTLSSFSILLPGFGLACLLGIASGLAVGSSPRLQPHWRSGHGLLFFMKSWRRRAKPASPAQCVR